MVGQPAMFVSWPETFHIRKIGSMHGIRCFLRMQSEATGLRVNIKYYRPETTDVFGVFNQSDVLCAGWAIQHSPPYAALNLLTPEKREFLLDKFGIDRIGSFNSIWICPSERSNRISRALYRGVLLRSSAIYLQKRCMVFGFFGANPRLTQFHARWTREILFHGEIDHPAYDEPITVIIAYSTAWASIFGFAKRLASRYARKHRSSRQPIRYPTPNGSLNDG